MNLKKWWRSRLSEDEITEFLTKTERTKCNVLLDRYYLLFKQYLQEKSSFYYNYILKPSREIGQRFEEILQGVWLLKNLEIF